MRFSFISALLFFNFSFWNYADNCTKTSVIIRVRKIMSGSPNIDIAIDITSSRA